MTTAALSLEPRSTRAGDNGFEPREGFEPFQPSDAEQSIPSRFCSVALARGDAIAIVHGETVLSYRTLLLRASGMAAALSEKLGDRPGPVVLQLPVGASAIEALLGVLFAGRAYMFLDPAAADGEITGTVAAAAPAAIVVDPSAPSRGVAAALQIRFDELAHAGGGVPAADPCSKPRDLACLFSTSGSTGTPKLVGLSHRAVLFDVGRQINDLCLGPDDRFDLLFSPSFSASLAPIFTALLTGGELHVLDVRDRLATLGRWLERAGITVSTMAVSTLRALCAAIMAGDGRPRPRLLSVGGEPLLPKDVAAFNAAFPPSCVLQNAMASTETRTYAQYFVPRVMQDDGAVPIGWPVHGKEIVLVDEDGLLVLSGQVGEIAVRSHFLADGYANDPDLTRARFVPQTDGTVLFRTRDRGRFREDGCLLFLGRADSLVKIRGYRVELEAVEAALARHERVSHSAVVVRELVPGEPSLAAYVVPCAGVTITVAEVRRYLTSALPAYAVPSSITVLDSLPVNRNGKVDRQALPTPQGGASSYGRPIPSAGATALSLADIWSGVLERPKIGPLDNFFDCGGDSLNALRLQMAIHERLGVDLPLDVLVRYPTVAMLAEWLDRAQASDGSSRALTMLQPEGAGNPLFCIPGIGGEPMQFQPLAQHLGFHRPVYGLRAPGGETATAEQSVEAIASAYLAEIDGVCRPERPLLLCGHSLGGLVAFEMARQLEVAGRRVGLLAIIDTPLRLGDARRVIHRVRDVFANLPAWVRYDMLESGWSNLAIRALGKAESMWRRLGDAAGQPGAEDELNLRSYFGVLNMPDRFRAIVTMRYRAACRYNPPAYPGTVTLFRAYAQPLTGRRDRHQGWADLAVGGVEVFDVPGHHDSCVSEPHVRHLADLLNARLAAVKS
jgi:acyl-coenzyme A synthetase/AMP-(fatty) acid ligase/thioesterase domain-containing protein/acyl carrier protein